jgi:hypothetical protein
VWRRRDALGPGLVAAGGTAMCAVAWWIASGDEPFRRQLTMVGISGIGVVLNLIAATAWVGRGRAVVRERMSELVRSGVGELTANRPLVLRSVDLTVSEPVGAAGLRRYHRPDCTMAAGQGWRPAPRAEHEEAGRRPCGVCRP